MAARIIIVTALVITVFRASGQVPFESSNLPILVIESEVPIVNEPKIEATMGIIDNGPGVRNFLSDPHNGYSGKIAIEIRGSSSQNFPKKQYGLELRDEAGNDMDAPLLGMPEEEDWILFGPYNDKTLMRDALAYKLGRDLGRYAPRTRFCEVVLNGSYDGIYLLMERIKRDKFRVDINKLNPDEILGDAVTGGYILKIDKNTGNPGGGFLSEHSPIGSAAGRHIYFWYEYPEYGELVSQQFQYIRSFMATFENVLAGPEFADPLNGYQRYMDADSFIDYMIINELSKNVDGYRLSTFMYKAKDSDGGKLHLGPIWDFNLGFGNANYCTNGNPEGFAVDFNSICPNDHWQIPFWWNRLDQDPAFRERLGKRWYELRQEVFSESRIHAYIDSVYTVLNSEAQQRNFARWPVLDQYVWPNYFVGETYQEEVIWLKNWISQRLAWLDDNFPPYIIAGDEEIPAGRIRVFPNPFSESISVSIDVANRSLVSFELVDVLGRTVYQSIEQPVPGTYERTHITRALPKGLYTYRLRIGSALLSGHVVK